MEFERKKLKAGRSRAGEAGTQWGGTQWGGTQDHSGVLGGLKPPEGLRVVQRGDWRQGRGLRGDNQLGSKKNLCQALTQGSLRGPPNWERYQKRCLGPTLGKVIFAQCPTESPPTFLPSFAEMGTSSYPHHHGSSSSPITPWFAMPLSSSYVWQNWVEAARVQDLHAMVCG